MYLLYVDESDTGSEASNTVREYWVTGVRVVDSSYRKTVLGLAQHTAPLTDRKGGFEVKGADLFNGTGAWKGRLPKERAEFALTYAKTLGRLNLKIYAVRKSSEDFTKDYLMLLGKLLAAVGKDTASKGSKTGRQLLTVFDRRTDVSVISSDHMRAVRSRLLHDLGATCAMIDFGYETDSRNAPLIQAADFSAYFLRKASVVPRNSTLFQEAESSLALDTIDGICAALKPKLQLVK